MNIFDEFCIVMAGQGKASEAAELFKVAGGFSFVLCMVCAPNSATLSLLMMVFIGCPLDRSLPALRCC